MARQAGLAERRARLSFGSIRERQRRVSGKIVRSYQASYADPQGMTAVTAAGNVRPVRHYAPVTFDTYEDAFEWLRGEKRKISAGTWVSPTASKIAAERQRTERPKLGAYAANWIEHREVKGRPLADRTKDSYLDYLSRFIEPDWAFGGLYLDEVTPQMVSRWYDDLKTRMAPRRKDDQGDAQRAKVYSFFRAVYNSATAADGPMPGAVNPVAKRGGGSYEGPRRDEQVVTADQFAVMLEEMLPKRRLMLMIALWCGLRFSELTDLRKTSSFAWNADKTAGVIRIKSATSRSKTYGTRSKDPKSAAGKADIPIPSFLIPFILDHLATLKGTDPLVFPSESGGHLAPSTFYGRETTYNKDASIKKAGHGWYRARQAAGRPDVHFHDLRASGATLVAQQPGVNESDIRAWLRDSTEKAAARYKRTAERRREAMASALDSLAKGGDW